MEPVTITAAVITNLAFTKVFETTIEKFTEGALTKMDQLRQKIWNKLRDNPTAEAALAEVENNRSHSHLEQVAALLQVEMSKDEKFAQEIQAITQEIGAGKLQANNSMTQNNYDKSTGYQTKVGGGTAFIGGTHYHGLDSNSTIDGGTF